MDGDYDSELEIQSDGVDIEDDGIEQVISFNDSDFDLDAEESDSDASSVATSDIAQPHNSDQPRRTSSRTTANQSSYNRQSASDRQTNSETDQQDDDDDEEDDVIKAIIAATKTSRTHPPDINIDDFVVDLSFHPDRDILAVGTMSGDTFIYRYGVEENQLMNTLELHTKAIRDIEFSLDGCTLYSTSKDRSILLSDVETGKFKRIYDAAHDQPVSKMNVFSETGFATGLLKFYS